jgi:succinate dehydrogenase / fumarate reductase, cytochrome b subunit
MPEETNDDSVKKHTSHGGCSTKTLAYLYGHLLDEAARRAHIEANNIKTQGFMTSHTDSRPLSPHLSVYKFHITMALSIFHRVLGVALVAVLALIVVWLWAAAYSPDCFAGMTEFLHTPAAGALLLAAGFAFYLKMALGLRHLFWDAGYGFAPATARKTGWLSIVFAIAATALTWALA